MIEVDDKELVRRAYLLDGQSERQIAKERKHARNSVAAVVADPKTATHDLTQVELDLEGTLVGLATVVTLREQHQRHLSVAHLATEPPTPPKPKASLDYLAALRAEYHAQQQRELGPLPFAHLSPPDANLPSASTPKKEK